MHGLVIWIRYLQNVFETVSFDFRTKKHIPGQNLNVTALPAWNHAGFFFGQRKSPPKWALQLSSFFIRCGAGCLPVSRRQSTDDSQCAKKHIRLAMSLRIGGFTTPKNLTSDETRFNAPRRCDRGTDAMHLANTPVVSPESKNPAMAGFRWLGCVSKWPLLTDYDSFCVRVSIFVSYIKLPRWGLITWRTSL